MKKIKEKSMSITALAQAIGLIVAIAAPVIYVSEIKADVKVLSTSDAVQTKDIDSIEGDIKYIRALSEASAIRQGVDIAKVQKLVDSSMIKNNE